MPFKKGHKINIGRKASISTRKKMSKNMLGNTRGVGHIGWLRGKKGYTNSGSFKKGMTPWSKGKKGIHLSPDSEFKKGISGKDHLQWKGGKTINAGYILTYLPDHPHAKGVYVYEHRLIVETIIGRYLQPHEIVHHLGKKSDNRPHKLMCFISKNSHNRFHKDPDSVKPSEIIYDGRKK